MYSPDFAIKWMNILFVVSLFFLSNILLLSLINYGKTLNCASGFQGKVHLLVIIVSQKFVLVGVLVPKATKCDTLLTESTVLVHSIIVKL